MGGANSATKPFFDPTSPSAMLKPGFLGSHPLFGGLEGFPRPGGPGGPPGDMHHALSLYHEELSKLQQSAIANAMKEQAAAVSGDRRPGDTPTSDTDNTDADSVEVKREVTKPAQSMSPPALQLKIGQSPQQHKSPFFPHTSDSVTSGHDTIPGTGSPLQRMANITNSLVTTPPSVSFGCPSRANLKTALPPITQQQFDR